MNFEIKFWSKVEIKSKDSCWLWYGGHNPKGYGVVYYNKRNTGAHRVSWILNNKNEIPKDHYVCHKCDSPSCVNPNHLFLGTSSENALDCYKKGRSGIFKNGPQYHYDKPRIERIKIFSNLVKKYRKAMNYNLKLLKSLKS